jgi:hypothetical protein
MVRLPLDDDAIGVNRATLAVQHIDVDHISTKRLMDHAARRPLHARTHACNAQEWVRSQADSTQIE